MITKQPAIYELVGNPIEVAAIGDTRVKTFFEISSGGNVLFVGSSYSFGTLPASMDISEILKSLLNYEYEDSNEFIRLLPGMTKPYSLRVWLEDDEAHAETVTGLHALPGGIGPDTFKKIAEQGQSYARLRYFGKLGNYFATTRTVGDVITMRDTEVDTITGFSEPDVVKMTITFPDGTSEVHTLDELTEHSFYNINLKKIVAQKELTAPFSLRMALGTLKPITINVVIAEPYRILRTLIFRNSLGAYERIHVSGIIDDGTDIDFEDGLYKQRVALGLFKDVRQRIAEREYVEGSIGWKTPDELLFIKDMLKSDRIYLETEGVRKQVLVEATSDIITRRDKPVPSSIDIKCRFIEDNLHVEDLTLCNNHLNFSRQDNNIYIRSEEPVASRLSIRVNISPSRDNGATWPEMVSVTYNIPVGQDTVSLEVLNFTNGINAVKYEIASITPIKDSAYRYIAGGPLECDVKPDINLSLELDGSGNLRVISDSPVTSNIAVAVQLETSTNNGGNWNNTTSTVTITNGTSASGVVINNSSLTNIRATILSTNLTADTNSRYHFTGEQFVWNRIVKTVSVGVQSGTLNAGTAGTITFPVITTGIANGTYAATVNNRPTGVSVQGQVTINNNTGTLTLAGNTTTVAGTSSSLTLTIDSTTSAAFSLIVASSLIDNTLFFIGSSIVRIRSAAAVASEVLITVEISLSFDYGGTWDTFESLVLIRAGSVISDAFFNGNFVALTNFILRMTQVQPLRDSTYRYLLGHDLIKNPGGILPPEIEG